MNLVSIKAIFFDRDGVIISDSHLISSREQVLLIDGAAEVVSAVRKMGYRTFLVSNQTVVSRGMLSLDEMFKLNNYILDLMRNLDPDAIFDDVYICPHHPNATLADFRVECHCRKPRPGMLIDAAEKHNINLERSFMIGDRTSDIIAGNKAGCCTIQIQSGMHDAKLIESSTEINEIEMIPNYLVTEIMEIPEIVAGNFK